jgi:hypothetical protein
MERGLLVELSPNEETALQRIAQGVTMDVQERHLVRLKAARIDRGDGNGLQADGYRAGAGFHCADRHRRSDQIRGQERGRSQKRLSPVYPLCL